MGAANEQLQDDSIIRAIRTQAYTNGESQRVVKLLTDEIVPDLERTLRSRLERIKSRGYDRGPIRTRQVQDTLVRVREIISAGTGTAFKSHKDEMNQLAADESKWQLDALDDASPISFQLNTPAPSILKQITSSRPIQGQPLQKWFRGMGNMAIVDTEKVIRRGLVEGQSVDDMVRQIVPRAGQGRTVLKKLRRNADAVVRTSVNHVVTQARQQTFIENKDVVKGWQFLATLDNKTSELCISLDGRQFPVGKGPLPPAHVRCRSTSTPVLKSLKEMGLKGDNYSPSTRASMDGQVPESTTMAEWLKKKVRDHEGRKLLEKRMGKAKTQAFIDGKLGTQDLIDAQNRVLTIKQLRAKGFEVGGPLPPGTKVRKARNAPRKLANRR